MGSNVLSEMTKEEFKEIVNYLAASFNIPEEKIYISLEDWVDEITTRHKVDSWMDKESQEQGRFQIYFYFYIGIVADVLKQNVFRY